MEVPDKKMNQRMKKRVESGDFRVCAAYDLAPVFEGAFGVRVKDLKRNGNFLDLMKERGLEIHEGDE